MKKIIIIIVAFFFFSTVNAQISGYMGNRFSFIYNGGISLPHISGLNGGPLKASPTISHGFNFEYIFNNSAAVGFRYKLGMNAGKNTLSSIYNSKTIDHTALVDFTEKYKFYSHSYGMYVKFYSRNSLAPIGVYTLLGVNFQQLILKDVIRPNYLEPSIITKQTYIHYDVALNFGFGRNWIVADRVLIGFQLETSMPFASLLNSTGLLSLYTGGQNEYNGYKSSVALSRYNLTAELLRLSVNVGFLAF